MVIQGRHSRLHTANKRNDMYVILPDSGVHWSKTRIEVNSDSFFIYTDFIHPDSLHSPFNSIQRSFAEIH